MTNTVSNYVYTLDDVYRIFQQTDDLGRIPLLNEWKAMNLPYLINWDNLIAKTQSHIDRWDKLGMIKK
jgi:hypothetical protein